MQLCRKRARMHYGIFTFGSRGDVQPCIAMALGLLEKGHEVTLAAPSNFRTFVEGYGVKFHPLAIDVEAMMAGEEGKEMMKTGNNVSLFKFVFKKLYEQRIQLRKSYLKASQGVDAIIANQACMSYISAIAEKSGKKTSYFYFMPPLVPTKEFAVPGLDFINFSWWNLFTYRFSHWAYWQFVKKDTNEFRKELGLPELKVSLTSYLMKQKILNIYNFSEQLLMRPKDWDDNQKITGFISLPGSKREAHPMDEIPANLSEWIDSGEKPVYIGFGSNVIHNQEDFVKILKEVLNQSDHRIVFCTSWSEIPDLPNHPNLFVVKSTNHDWLMPKCKVAVIHGGAGTLATVLRSQIPVIIASRYTDQPTWGKIVEKKKAGIHIPFQKLNSKNLLQAISSCQNQEILLNAAAIGKKIKEEDGLKMALKALESYFQGK